MAETLVSKIVANAGKNWSRNTVADGNWLNANTIVKLNQNDKTLAEAIDELSASMPHILPEYPGFELDLAANETIKHIEQKRTGELIVEKQGIDIESSTLNDKLWAHLKTNKGCPVNNQYTKLYDQGENPPELNYLEPGAQGDGCTTTNLVLKPGIYSIYLELAYKPGSTPERIEKELSVRLCNGIDQIPNAEFTFHCNDTYTEIDQHRLINAVVKFEEQGTLAIEGKTEAEHAGGTLQIVNLYIVSVGGATGPKGDEGDPGAPGFSPIVEITEASRQHTIKITDSTHTVTTLVNDGSDGKSVELSANPLNAHLNWRQVGDTNWTDTGFAVSGEVGPRGTSPTVTSTPNPSVGGYDVTFHYGDSSEYEKTITVPSGVSGTSISARSSKTGKKTTVTLFDPYSNPEHEIDTFEILDGQDGQGSFDPNGHYVNLSAGYADNARFSDNSVSSMDQIKSSIDLGNGIAQEYKTHSGDYVTSAVNLFDTSHKYGLQKDGQGHVSWTQISEDDTHFDNSTQGYHTLSGTGESNSPIGVNTDLFYKKTETSGATELSTEFGKYVQKQTGVDIENKDWIWHIDAQGNQSWTEAQTWLANRIVPEDGLSGYGDATNGQYHFGISGFKVYNDCTISAKQFQNADGTETINGTTYNFSGVDNIEILPKEAANDTAYFPNDNVLRFILES